MTLRKDLPELPDRMRRLHVHRGYPVPWFVTWMKDGEVCDDGEGEPEFRVITTGKLKQALQQKRCWVCGDHLGRFKSFVAGPMCGVNRISAEPPAHRDCARFSAKGCPFLTRPHARRREAGMPVEEPVKAGKAILRNPGVAMVWTTKHFTIFEQDEGLLMRMGEPESIEWYAEGKPATRAQIFESIDSGLPTLNKDEDEVVAVNNEMAADRLRQLIINDPKVPA